MVRRAPLGDPVVANSLAGQWSRDGDPRSHNLIRAYGLRFDANYDACELSDLHFCGAVPVLVSDYPIGWNPSEP
jgi:hypothetical protein